ncbi:hypothetical protein [Trebonia sp.]|uniref:hypothetical protein n=1 Tax=Trebonia sp. TaxID=2767075 RepID=UPI0026148918|nr:hypothetical protein [Trebonia sp.]
MAGDQLGHRRLLERAGRQDRAFRVGRHGAAEQLVVQRGVDHRHGEQVHRERERVGAKTQAVGADPAVRERVRHRPGERPARVVDRRFLAAVVLVRAEQLLGEFAEHAPPQVEVVGLVPRGLAGRLEDADRDHLHHAAGVPDPRRVPPVQRERRRARRSVVPEQQRGDGHRRRPGAQVARVADGGPQPLFPPRGVLVRDRPADVHRVEVTAAGERQAGASAGRGPGRGPGQVGLGQPVDRAILEDGGRREVGHHVAVAAVAGAVAALWQQVRRDARHVEDGGRGLRAELEPDVRQRHRGRRPPRAGGEQRGAGNAGLRRVPRRGANRQLGPAGAHAGVDPQPLQLRGGALGGGAGGHRASISDN